MICSVENYELMALIVQKIYKFGFDAIIIIIFIIW